MPPRRSLRGRRVLITRAEEDEDTLRVALVSLGAQVVSVPTIRRGPPDDEGPLQSAAARMHEMDALAVGSLAALRPLADRMAGPTDRPIGCVGEKTAAGLDADPGLAHLFGGPRIVPHVFRAEALVEAMRRYFSGDLTDRRVLVPRAPEGRTTLADGLRAAHAVVDEVLTYRIVPAEAPSPGRWRAAQVVDAALFMSGETLSNFLRIVPEPEGRGLLARVVVGVIGPVAAARAEALGVRVDVVPAMATQAALVEALAARLGPRPE